MNRFLCLSLILFCGCTQKSQIATPSGERHPPQTILEGALANPDFHDSIAQAERDLPGDQWQDKPWRLNVDRARRELAVSAATLASIRPKLDQLSVRDLVRSLKVIPHPDGFFTNSISGVAAYVYANGNRMIIEELKTRPKNELKILTRLGEDNVGVFGREQGYPLTLAEVIKYEILREEPRER